MSESVICLDCNSNEGTLLKEFQEDPEKNYSWHDLAMMTECCVCCGSTNIKNIKERNENNVSL
ncbi:MAG: hypothetical protein VW810_05730 [Pelagibacteraceae bacterium]